MSITISDRAKPFSHESGHKFILPGTRVCVQAFPTALIFKESQEIELCLDLKGPVDPFTFEQDLERRELRIYGEAEQGYFRLSIKAEHSSAFLRFEKTPASGIQVNGKPFKSGDTLEVMKDVEIFQKPFEERLFLGSSKHKDTDQIRLRRDLREILPLWHFLGAITPSKELKAFPLLEEAIARKDKKAVQNLLLHTYQAYLTSGLVPRKEDEERQGLLALKEEVDSLLQSGSSSIRSLFFQEKEDGFYILPCLISLFVCGKMTHIQTQSGCLLDIEWTKHRLRRMSIQVQKDQVLKLHFPSDVESFRVKIKASSKDRGKVFPGKGTEIAVKAGDVLALDLFQK